jgi:hypothetical protein
MSWLTRFWRCGSRICAINGLFSLARHWFFCFPSRPAIEQGIT